MNDEQPDWSQAPTWAKFWTRDVSGVAIWWETKPVHDGQSGIWICEDDSRRTICYSNAALLRQRPPV